jgi:DNA-binding NarL/FixJ family response regulator
VKILLLADGPHDPAVMAQVRGAIRPDAEVGEVNLKDYRGGQGTSCLFVDGTQTEKVGSLLRQIVERVPEVPAIVLIEPGNWKKMRACFLAGALDCLESDAGSEALRESMRHVQLVSARRQSFPSRRLH